jgi:hypothetical protein
MVARRVGGVDNRLVTERHAGFRKANTLKPLCVVVGDAKQR